MYSHQNATDKIETYRQDFGSSLPHEQGSTAGHHYRWGVLIDTQLPKIQVLPLKMHDLAPLFDQKKTLSEGLCLINEDVFITIEKWCLFLLGSISEAYPLNYVENTE